MQGIRNEYVMHLPLAKISVRQLEMYPLWKESVDYLELEKRLLIAHKAVKRL